MVNPSSGTITDPTKMACVDQRFNVFADSATMLATYDALQPGSQALSQLYFGVKQDIVPKGALTKYDVIPSTK